MKPTKKTAVKILELLKHGLSYGLGEPVPGKMCVEAAVCYAMRMPHSDDPKCVSKAVRSFKIALNDSNWSSNQARAKGLRRLALAQLGSDSINETAFVEEIALETIRKIVPIAIRAAAKLNPEHAKALNISAKNCEESKDSAEGINAARAAARAAEDANAYYALTAAYYAARAADAAEDDEDAAVYAARATEDAANAADASAEDGILSMASEIAVKALITCKSPGCKWLYLCDEKEAA